MPLARFSLSRLFRYLPDYGPINSYHRGKEVEREREGSGGKSMIEVASRIRVWNSTAIRYNVPIPILGWRSFVNYFVG